MLLKSRRLTVLRRMRGPSLETGTVFEVQQSLKEHSSELTTRKGRGNHGRKQWNRTGYGQTVCRGRRLRIYHWPTEGGTGQGGCRDRQEGHRDSERRFQPRRPR